MSKLKIVDCTLREGEQTPGVFFTQKEKIRLARLLDRTGVSILDAGMPSVSGDEQQNIRALSRIGLRASLGVSVRMRKQEIDLALDCGAEEIFLICPVSDMHMQSKLGLNREKVLRVTRDITSYALDSGLNVNLVAEDAVRSEPDFVCLAINTASEAGAKMAVICDTVGISEPFIFRHLIEQIKANIPPNFALGSHCHNDFGLATANTLAAVQAGAMYPSVTVNGLGERAGNAPLQEVILGVERLLGLEHDLDLGLLLPLAQMLQEASGVFIPVHAPVTGRNAFTHESGIHVDGMLKNLQTYSAIDPDRLERKTSFVLGKHSGINTIRAYLQEKGLEANEKSLRLILEKVKEYKVTTAKENIREHLRQLDEYYQMVFEFPPEEFWRIVRKILHV